MLRGNTFLILMLRSARKTECVSNLFRDLIRIIRPSFTPQKTFVQYFSQYLSGARPHSDKYYPFRSSLFRAEANFRLSQDSNDMRALCLTYFDDDYAIRLLVGGIVESILQDDTFKEPVCIGREWVSKKELADKTLFCLTSFLFGVWCQIVRDYPEPSRETFLRWTQSAGARVPRIISTNIGSRRAEALQIFL